MFKVLEVWQPAKAGKAMQFKQFSEMAKTATGMTIKNGQSSKAVREQSNNVTEVFIGQYFWLPSVFETYKKEDPRSTYVLEHTQQCNWNPSLSQFARCYVCLSIAKTFWEH
jgi:hypothetical protein